MREFKVKRGDVEIPLCQCTHVTWNSGNPGICGHCEGAIPTADEAKRLFTEQYDTSKKDTEAPQAVETNTPRANRLATGRDPQSETPEEKASRGGAQQITDEDRARFAQAYPMPPEPKKP